MATIPYANVVDRKLLPIDAQNIVTKVRLVIAGDMAGETPEQLQVSRIWDTRPESNSESYVPEPVTYVYEAPEHAAFGAERSFSLPSGVNPFLPPTDPLIPDPDNSGWDNPGVPSAVRDGDPFTYAEITGSGLVRLTYPNTVGVPYVGWRLMYHLEEHPDANPPYVSTNYRRDFVTPPRYRYQSVRSARLPVVEEEDAANDLYSVLPPDARFNQVNNVPVFDGPLRTSVALQAAPASVMEMRVYHFYPLALNEVLLESIAQAQVRLPGLVPSRVTVRGYVQPDRTHTITGWPGGDYTGRVAQHQYELGRTVIDFEQAGAPVGLPAEAMEAARERQAAVDNDILTANYNLKMGSRR